MSRRPTLAVPPRRRLDAREREEHDVREIRTRRGNDRARPRPTLAPAPITTTSAAGLSSAVQHRYALSPRSTGIAKRIDPASKAAATSNHSGTRYAANGDSVTSELPMWPAAPGAELDACSATPVTPWIVAPTTAPHVPSARTARPYH